ncbi:MAG: chitinase, partial [Lachnospiraceae bacterium]|nr:chitinase [Lachnospiraceae bacterium]
LFVKEKMDDRFYYDYKEQLLIYTLPGGNVTVNLTDAGYIESGEFVTSDHLLAVEKSGEVFVAVDYLKKYVNFTYEFHPADTYGEDDEIKIPARLVLYTEWEDRQVADINKDTQIRVKGGIKSEVLEDLCKGEAVTVVEEMESWTKVMTGTAVIGYVENKCLDEPYIVAATPETAVAAPEYPSLTRDHKINMVWNLVTNVDANEKTESLLAQTKGINTISPTWFALSDNEGNISSCASSSYVSNMHAKGIEVWAMLDNFTHEGIDLMEILPYTSKRGVLITNVLAQAQSLSIDGINLDFESVPREAAQDYIQFIRELSLACHQNNLVLSVDNYVPTEYTEHYNRKEQGVFADYVIIMGYDEHWLGSTTPGSVASIDYVENGIADTVAVVPKEKVINALPFYTILWGVGDKVTSKALAMGAAETHVRSKGVTAAWDEATCQNYAAYSEDGVDYQIWLEDEKSIEIKLNVMKQYGIAGVSGWRLGMEKQVIWDKIAEYMAE